MPIVFTYFLLLFYCRTLRRSLFDYSVTIYTRTRGAAKGFLSEAGVPYILHTRSRRDSLKPWRLEHHLCGSHTKNIALVYTRNDLRGPVCIYLIDI
ncbi:hypothetical protein F4818DRAFT_6261 [Hypoxylon cercidicola]|nr:hypothetical protein F4818DRAFT_6261 [Hypoxylon cercidicola]